MTNSARGTALLTFTTLIWGTTFLITKKTLDHFFASELILGRFLVAGLVFLPFLRLGSTLWLAAFELGTLLWIGFATQTIGLAITNPNRSAFITSLHVICVPMILRVFGKKTRPMIWIAAGVAAGGVYLLSHDRGLPNRGDLWTLACAISWAIYIIRLERWTAHLPSKPLTAAHLWVVVFWSVAWTACTGRSKSPIPWAAVLYLGFFATAATTWFQTIGQKWVVAPRAAVLFTMEPVWSLLFAWSLAGLKLGPAGLVGAAMILLASIGAQMPTNVELPVFGRTEK